MMQNKVRIQLMGNFALYINETKIDNLLTKSPKGVQLMCYLIVHRGEAVPNYRILDALWNEDESSNPENALKTLVSRFRALLNQSVPGLGACISANRGAYQWENDPDISIDLYELEDTFAELNRQKDHGETYLALCEKMLSLYKGDLLQENAESEWVLSRGTALHNSYMNALYAYVETLKQLERYEDVAVVCREGLDVDRYDDHLHMELMNALIKTDRTSDALAQYKHVMHLNYHYLGVQPSEDMQAFYKRIVQAGKTLDFNLESIRNELRESGANSGAFVCEYAVFKEIYNLQMRNLERLGSTMFLSIVMVSSPVDALEDSMKQNNITNSVLEVMRTNLRKGDTITHVSPTIFALLLPTVNYTTGTMVMERIKKQFYKIYPNSDVNLSYRVGPLTSNMEKPKSN